MKEQTLIEMKNKVEAQNRVLQQIINELSYLRELGIGTLETIKLMPNYEEAIEKLKKNMEANIEEKKKAKENGTID